MGHVRSFIKNFIISLEDRKKNKEYKKDFKKFSVLSEKVKSRFELSWENRYPCLHDKVKATPFDRHYIYHPAWAARILYKTKPDFHVDISSLLDFSTIVSAFVPVKFYDYRPAKVQLDNFSSEAADLTALPFASGSLKSISCMHTVEHIGLGRYGDPLDYDGDIRAISELKRVTAPNGNLLFVVPIGKSRIMFNAHRIYSYDQIISYFDDFDLMDFSLIPDNENDGGLLSPASKEAADLQNYACGCFWFKKK
jgi:SAM-dependent methyltransferase